MDGWHSADHILVIKWPFVSLGGGLTEGLFRLWQRGDEILVYAASLPWWWCGEGGDLGPWHGGPESDLLLAYEALLVGCLHQAQGAALRNNSGCACFCFMLGRSIQLVHTQVPGHRCGVLMDLLPILYPQVCRWVRCVPWSYLWVLQDFDGRRVFCQAWPQGKWLWAEI